MAKNAKAEFYWKDWASDRELRLCSLAARGLWMEMLCIMAEADPPGYLLVKERPLALADLSRLAASSEAEAGPLLDELDQAGVFSRDRTGVIYSRRMVRDDKRRKTAQKNGKLGGNPTIRKSRENSLSDNRSANGADKEGVGPPVAPLVPLNHSTTVPLGASPSAAVSYDPRTREGLLLICKTLGKSPATDASLIVKFTEELRTLLAEGFDIEQHLLPAAHEAVNRGANVKTLNYLRPRASELRAVKNGTGEFFDTNYEPTNEQGWRTRLNIAKKLMAEHKLPIEKCWGTTWGPPPGQPHCQMPETFQPLLQA